jgi:hypothetical protein
MTWATERSLFNLFLLPSWIDREIDVQRRVICSQITPAGPAPPVGSVNVRRHSRPLAIAAAVVHSSRVRAPNVLFLYTPDEPADQVPSTSEPGTSGPVWLRYWDRTGRASRRSCTPW